MRVFLVQTSEPHEKLPVSRRIARNLVLPPRTRTECTRLGPILVIAICRPMSYFLFLWYWGFLPPVRRRLCRLSRLIPMTNYTLAHRLRLCRARGSQKDTQGREEEQRARSAPASCGRGPEGRANRRRARERERARERAGTAGGPPPLARWRPRVGWAGGSSACPLQKGLTESRTEGQRGDVESKGPTEEKGEWGAEGGGERGRSVSLHSKTTSRKALGRQCPTRARAATRRAT